MQTSRTTLSDVAAEAGVSKATASRVLSGSRDRVSEELTERVLRAASRLDYVPNPHAQALATAASPLAAVIVHDVADPYFSEIARGALRVAAVEDRLVMICNTFRDPEREVAYLRELRIQRVHAVLVAGSSTSGLDIGGRLSDELEAYRSEGGRVALMLAGHGYPAAVPDNRGGGRLAAEHLSSLGHRHMAVVAGPSAVGSVGDRLRGFLEVVDEQALAPPLVAHADFTRSGGAAAADRILAERPDVTAILALNDLMAVGVVRRLEESGRQVPRDVSVMGFDDIPLAEDLQPRLTTVRVPMEEIGAAAMEMALQPDADDPDPTKIFDTELIVRDSTAKPLSEPPN